MLKQTFQLLEYNTLRNDYDRRIDDILPGYNDTSPSSVRGIYQRTSTSNWSNNRVSFTLRVYSEIYVKDQGIGLDGSKYYTDYTIIIVKSTTALTMNAVINLNQTNSTHNNIGAALEITNRQMPATGSISALFVGTTTGVNNLIPNAHELTIHNLYHTSVNANNVIDPSYYQLELIQKGSLANLNQFGFNMTLSDALQAGDYVIQYSYYNSSALRTITFEKNAATAVSITGVNYDTYSFDTSGDDLSFTAQSNDFKTYIEFGFILDHVTQTAQGLSIEETISSPSYTSNLAFYKLKLNETIILDEVKLAPFLELESASISYRYITAAIVSADSTLSSDDLGKQYIVTYVVALESGGMQTIVQTIEERTPDAMLVYSDDNLQTSYSFDITREAIETRVDINFNLYDPQMYQNILVYLDAVAIDGIYDYSEDAVNTVYFGDNLDKFNLILTSNLDIGKKQYDFILEREGAYYNLGTIYINKLLGISAYLLDIRYPNVDEVLLQYPTIRASDNTGVPNQLYDTRVFF